MEFDDHALVRMDEAIQGQAERVEAALQPLDHENLHELGEVALALSLAACRFALVVCQRSVTGVFEFGRQQPDGLVENLVFQSC